MMKLLLHLRKATGYLQSKESISKQPKIHKQQLDKKVDHHNVAMLYGTEPGKIVDADTTMVKDFVKTLVNRFDKRTLAVQIPDALDQMKGKDTNFEMVVTSTIQPLKLHY